MLYSVVFDSHPLKTYGGVEMKRFIPLILAAGLASPVQAFDGNDLSVSCRYALEMADNPSQLTFSTEVVGNGNFCLGVVFGVIEAVNVLRDKGLVSNWCIPKIRASQAIRIVDRYQQENPEELHFDAALNVIDAMREAYPCPDVAQ